MPITKDYLHFGSHATMEDVLRTYLDRGAHWWWLLTTERAGQYYVCSFGSLLPYLTGRTPHIVHRIGDCPICSGLDPLLWQDTDSLVQEALANEAIRARTVSDLPMAELPVVSVQDTDQAMLYGPACGVIAEGRLAGVHIVQVKGDLGAMPGF